MTYQELCAEVKYIKAFSSRHIDRRIDPQKVVVVFAMELKKRLMIDIIDHSTFVTDKHIVDTINELLTEIGVEP